jgi:hypothetical protein
MRLSWVLEFNLMVSGLSFSTEAYRSIDHETPTSANELDVSEELIVHRILILFVVESKETSVRLPIFFTAVAPDKAVVAVTSVEAWELFIAKMAKKEKTIKVNRLILFFFIAFNSLKEQYAP